MSFQDIRNNGGIRPASSKPQTPSQSIAAGIFQINTAVTAFRRLVDAIGTSKDTPNHRQKMHNTRQRILQLVKDTSSKLKALSESDHAANISIAMVCGGNAAIVIHLKQLFCNLNDSKAKKLKMLSLPEIFKLLYKNSRRFSSLLLSVNLPTCLLGLRLLLYQSMH
ncbi:Syntaxin-22 [Bienertia sinuspersici]